MSPSPTLYLFESDGLDDSDFTISGEGTMVPTRRPFGGCRSLVIETAQTTVVVDPGLGHFDWLAPRRRLGMLASRRLRHTERPRRILRRHMEHRGICPDRVEHVVLSHTHLDHLGGLGDFPGASIHALPNPLLLRRASASSCPLPQLAHLPNYLPPAASAVDWFGLRSHRLAIDSLELSLLELPGHAPTHAGVLLRYDGGYVLHLGDLVTCLEELFSPRPPSGVSEWIRAFRDSTAFDRLCTRDRLRRLARQPPMTLSFVAARGHTARISVGRGPYPSIGFL